MVSDSRVLRYPGEYLNHSCAWQILHRVEHQILLPLLLRTLESLRNKQTCGSIVEGEPWMDGFPPVFVTLETLEIRESGRAESQINHYLV